MPATHFSKKDFGEKVLKSAKPVMVDFWAQWCAPCKMADLAIDELAEEYQDKIVMGKVDVDKEQELASKYGVMSLPTVLIFKDGKEVERKVGFPGKEVYQEMIKKYI